MTGISPLGSELTGRDERSRVFIYFIYRARFKG